MTDFVEQYPKILADAVMAETYGCHPKTLDLVARLGLTDDPDVEEIDLASVFETSETFDLLDTLHAEPEITDLPKPERPHGKRLHGGRLRGARRPSL